MTTRFPPPPEKRFHLLGATLTVLGACLPGLLWAAASQAGSAVHVVSRGETLSGLARQYSGSASDWRELQKLNGLKNPRTLQPGTALRLPEQWAHLMASARLEQLHGRAWVTSANGQMVEARQGDLLKEGQQVRLGSDSRALLVFGDGSQAQLSGQANARIDALRTNPAGSAHRTRILLVDGRIDSAIPPGNGVRRQYDIQTPYAVASVRGTRFGVTVVPGQGTRSEVYAGVVSLKKGERSALMLKAGEGGISRSGPAQPTRLPLAPLVDAAAIRIDHEDPQVMRIHWASTGESGTWHIRIYPGDGGTTALREATTDRPDVRFAGVEDGHYTLRIQRVDANGLRGQIAEKQIRFRHRPMPPLSVSPLEGEQIAQSRVELKCSVPVEADRVRLQVAADETFLRPVADLPDLKDCRHTLELPAGQYFWRLASLQENADGTTAQGTFGAARRFRVLPNAPSVPAPQVGTERDALVVHWKPQAGWQYRVSVFGDPNSLNALRQIEASDGSVRVPGLPPGRYFVRLQSIDTYGQVSPLSPAQAVDLGSLWRDSAGHPIGAADSGFVLQQLP